MATQEASPPASDGQSEHPPADMADRPVPLIVRVELSDNPSLPGIPERGQDDEHALAHAIREDWRTSRARPSLKKIHEHRSRQGLCDAPHVTIVCLGEARLPALDDYRFEPVVVPLGSTRQLPHSGIVLLVAAMLLGGMQWIPGMSATFPSRASLTLAALGFGYVTIGALAAGFRSRYARIAPGAIQVMTFTAKRTKPSIRSYEMAGGTLAVCTRLLERHSLELMRGDNVDVLPLSTMDAETLDRIGWALTSTAPTPPLSDEELLG